MAGERQSAKDTCTLTVAGIPSSRCHPCKQAAGSHVPSSSFTDVEPHASLIQFPDM